MSILTKVLIVLLTISSFLLCATVVTYVSEAENYKEKSQKLTSNLANAQAEQEKAQKQLEEKTAAFQKEEDRLNKEIASLNGEIKKLQANIADFTRDVTSLKSQVETYQAMTKDFSATTDKQTQLFKNTFDELTKVKAQKESLDKKVEEVTSQLIEKMAFIDTLNSEKKRLQEKNSELQKMLDEKLQPAGEKVYAPTAVTPERDKAKGEPSPAIEEIGLKGTITEVDLKNSLASISISAADGVKEGMRFHIIRGDEYICDLLIINVDAEQAVGALELMGEQQPKVGDTVSTNF